MASVFNWVGNSSLQYSVPWVQLCFLWQSRHCGLPLTSNCDLTLSVYFTLGTSIYYQVVLFHPPHPGFGSRYSNPYMPLTFSCILNATAHFLVLVAAYSLLFIPLVKAQLLSQICPLRLCVVFIYNNQSVTSYKIQVSPLPYFMWGFLHQSPSCSTRRNLLHLHDFPAPNVFCKMQSCHISNWTRQPK